VLGVDGVVLDGGVEPQPVALLAVVEGPLELAPGALAPSAPAAAAAAALLARVLILVLVVVVLVVVAGLGSLSGLGGATRLLLGAGGLGGLELGRDEGVVLGAQVDLVVEVAAAGAGGQRAVAVAVRDEVVLLLERLDLLDGDFELMSDPGVGAPLADPAADLVEVRSL
jgi:hypothetical protein